jgi:hypothetical protein
LWYYIQPEKKRFDIRVVATHQHYDQEYDFPELVPLIAPPRAIELRTQRLLQDAAGGEEVFRVDI